MLSIIYLRAEQDFEVNIGVKKGAVTGLLMGVVAAIVSLVLIISLEAFLAQPIYDLISNVFSFLGTDMLNIVISLSGADVALSLNAIFTRLLVTLFAFPVLGLLFGAIGAKFLR